MYPLDKSFSCHPPGRGLCLSHLLISTPPPPRELRMSSDQQADIQLAQTIKDQYMSRVRVATQVRGGGILPGFIWCCVDKSNIPNLLDTHNYMPQLLTKKILDLILAAKCSSKHLLFP